MNLNALRYFQEVSRHGSLTAAARHLGVSQPALSVAMQQLEEEVGSTLLLRDRRGVRLTDTGQELLHYVGEVFALLDKAQQRIQGLEVEEVGHFTIGCPDVLGAYFLPPMLKSLMASSSQIEMSLWNGPSPACYEALLRREVDFALIVNPLPHPDLVLVRLFSDATDFFMATSAWERATSCAPWSLQKAEEVLQTGPLLFVDGLQQSRSLLSSLAEQELLPKRLMRCGTYELVKSLVLSGIGVALIPRRVALYNQVGQLRRLHPALPYVPDTIYMVYRADLHRTQAARRVREAIVKRGEDLANDVSADEASV